MRRSIISWSMWGKTDSAITCLADLGYVGRIHNRDLFGIKVIYRYRNACPCKCALAIGSNTERDRRTWFTRGLRFSFVAYARSRVSRATFPFPSRAPVITHGVITYRERDKKKNRVWERRGDKVEAGCREAGGRGKEGKWKGRRVRGMLKQLRGVPQNWRNIDACVSRGHARSTQFFKY